MKEQNRISEKQLSDLEISNLHVKDFTVMIVKTIQGLIKKIGSKDEQITRNTEQRNRKFKDSPLKEGNQKVVDICSKV